MPISPENRKRYPRDWKAISERIRYERAGNACEWCGAENHEPHPETGSIVVLTVAHIDHTPENCANTNLVALCQKCHLSHDARHHAASARATRERKSGQQTLFVRGAT